MTKRKTFTSAFKLEIAKLMVDENYTIKQACEASGAGETAVKRWRQQYLAELAGTRLPNAQALTSEQREIQHTKQRIRQLETEKDMLKKPAPFMPFMPFMPRGCRRYLCQGKEMGYGLVNGLKEAYSVSHNAACWT